MEALKIVLTDSRFYAALVVLAQAILFYLRPEFPEAIWVAVNGLLGIVLAILVGNGVVKARAAARHG